jgi:NADH:ubiquinone oxidoreductase subunit 4 (subunit M)
MLLSCLLIIPIIGTIGVASVTSFVKNPVYYIKNIGLISSILTLLLSLFIFVFFDLSSNQYQFIQATHYNVQLFDIYLGLDNISIYFVLLTTIIMPIALLSN